MFDFIQTETGWRVYWEMDPQKEAAQEEAAQAASLTPVEEEAPVLVQAEAGGLGPMAV